MLEIISEKVKKYKAVLVAVSKTRSIEEITSVYNKGVRHFGENRARELEEKQAGLPKDIIWHMIGHLQKNKVKYIAEFVDYIHSVDSYTLLMAIQNQAQKHDRIIKVLLQMKIATEDTKYGLTLESVDHLIEKSRTSGLKNVQICGVMGMATFTDNDVQIGNEFEKLKGIFNHIKNMYFSSHDSFKEISMGMSGDYIIALEKGATIIRVGSLIFGPRR